MVEWRSTTLPPSKGEYKVPMKGAGTRLPAVTAWRAQELRLTYFLAQPMPEKSDLWKEVFSQPTETTTHKKLLRTDEGLIKEKLVSLHIDPQRVNCTIRCPIDVLNPPAHGLPFIGPLPDALRDWQREFDKVLGCLPDGLRVAFGASLLQTVDGHKEGYALLNEYLPDVRLSLDARDFTYRINRQRVSRSGIEDLLINRLSTWSFLHWDLQLRTSVDPTGGQIAYQDKGFACKLDLDINTPAERKTPLPKSRLPEIWSELTELGVEIATDGDIP